MRKFNVVLAAMVGTALALGAASASAATDVPADVAASPEASSAPAAGAPAADSFLKEGNHPLIAGLRQLKLSENQISSIRKIFSAHREELHAAREAAHEKLVNFVGLDPQSPSYTSKISELADHARSKVSERMQRAAELQAQIYAILKPEQKAQLVPIANAVIAKHFSKKPEAAKVDRLGSMLALSDEQRAQVKGILDRYSGQTLSMRQAGQTRVVRFLSLDPTAATYKSDIDALTNEFAQAAQDRVQTMASLQTDLYAVLTPEQRTKLLELAQKDPKEVMSQMRQGEAGGSNIL